MSAKGIFKHSVPVPRIYKIASKIARNAKNGTDSLKNLVYQEKHVNIKTVYALVVETFKKNAMIEDLLEKSELLIKEPRFDPWLAKILICEMLWGKNKMKGDSKPLQTILEYEALLKKLLPDCTDIKRDILKHNVIKPRYVRVNLLKITMEEAVNNFRDDGWILVKFSNHLDYQGFLERLNNLESNEFMIDLHIPDLLIFPPKTEFHNHEAYKSRSIILQDKASCLPVHLLNPTPGATVIDMCAAPGMKTTQLAAMLKNSGTLHAVELDKNRAIILRDFVESAGATCVKTLLKDVMQVNDSDCPGVEYVLVDPSCTGSGITDRVEIENSDFHSRMERLKKLCNFQAKLLRHATTSFPQAKRIVYSTCSMNAEENEDVVRQVLETCKNFKLVDAKKLLKSWNDSSSEVFPVLGKMCVYATPEKDRTNGFFIAVLERLKDGEINPYLNVELCKIYDKGKKVSKNDNQENRKTLQQKKFKKLKDYQSGKNYEVNEGQEVDEENNHSQENDYKKFQQKPNVKNEYINLKMETCETEVITQSDSKDKKRKSNNIEESPLSIKMKKSKQGNIHEQQKLEAEVAEKSDDSIFNEKLKSKKRKQVMCDATSEILRNEHPEGNIRKKKRKLESYEENMNNEILVNISKNNDENITKNEIKNNDEKRTQNLNQSPDHFDFDPEKHEHRNEKLIEKENEASEGCSTSNYGGVKQKKDKKKSKKHKESFIQNETEISNEDNIILPKSKVRNEISIDNPTEVIISKKKRKKQEKELMKQNEDETSINNLGLDQNMNSENKNKKHKLYQDTSETIEDKVSTKNQTLCIDISGKKKSKSKKLSIQDKKDEIQIENSMPNENSKRKKKCKEHNKSLEHNENSIIKDEYSKKIKKKQLEIMINKNEPTAIIDNFNGDISVKRDKSYNNDIANRVTLVKDSNKIEVKKRKKHKKSK